MKVSVSLVFPFVVLLVLVCVSADRANVEQVKGAPRTLGRMQRMPKEAGKAEEFSKLLKAMKTVDSRMTCEECKTHCATYCTTCAPENCLQMCTDANVCP